MSALGAGGFESGHEQEVEDGPAALVIQRLDALHGRVGDPAPIPAGVAEEAPDEQDLGEPRRRLRVLPGGLVGGVVSVTTSIPVVPEGLRRWSQVVLRKVTPQNAQPQQESPIPEETPPRPSHLRPVLPDELPPPRPLRSHPGEPHTFPPRSHPDDGGRQWWEPRPAQVPPLPEEPRDQYPKYFDPNSQLIPKPGRFIFIGVGASALALAGGLYFWLDNPFSGAESGANMQPTTSASPTAGASQQTGGAPSGAETHVTCTENPADKFLGSTENIEFTCGTENTWTVLIHGNGTSFVEPHGWHDSVSIVPGQFENVGGVNVELVETKNGDDVTAAELVFRN